MIHIKRKADCCGSQACAQICPKHYIIMQVDAEGFLYPCIDGTVCLDCGACEKACPVLHSEPEPMDKKPTAYAAINLDEKIRRESSSGGIFTLLAEQTLDNGGIVYGVAMTTDQHSVYHFAVETKSCQRHYTGRITGISRISTRDR